MRIITTTCPECGTVVAANELESNRVMKCPGFGCEHVHRFSELPVEAQEHFLENKDRYEI
ncbi:hypothetical protein C499_13100 [Halogeometricum borinquense DSM 11551]|uniref:Uncharacterized protein n=2 Tax=Halogeometricum borinquense TaxID=60847 RepID=E4NUG4_HALBP|nr:hypothetical protein [Halogeometricum borinquense]ADQ68684.1 hypothetical protein Hbor_31490 [Halogeometricum borinquense DSM 11551]ELY25425.1 hypothetical protein C499_13100 [Halogeometricum borinquense DSM 11551]RYJ08634.1 hypothetical protein ELS19_19305 [Halogeometricum borinquense]